MRKKLYRSPIIVFDLDDGGDPTIILPGSQQPVGTDTQFSFEDIDEDTIEAILNYCSDLDLKAMAGEDFIVTSEEFNAWLKDNPWFENYL